MLNILQKVTVHLFKYFVSYIIVIPQKDTFVYKRKKLYFLRNMYCIILRNIYIYIFFLYQGFHQRHWRFTGQKGKGGDHLLFHSTTSTRSWTLRHLFATLHVKWISCIFSCNVCVYQTTTRWDLPLHRVTTWVIDWWCNVCLFTCAIFFQRQSKSSSK